MIPAPMSVETARRYPALGFDPAPGATERIWSLGVDLRSVAAELDAAHQTLISIGRGRGVWQGEAAEAFHDRLSELPGYLDKAHHSLGDAAAALNQWSADLASMQTTAAQYEAEAAQALQQLRAAESNPDLRLGGQVFADDTTLAQAQARYGAAISQVDNAAKELEDIRGLAQRLLAQHEELVGEVANALRRAKDEAPKEPGLLDRIVGGFVDGVKDFASAAVKWVQDHVDLIAQFGGLMNKVSTALGVLAIITAPFEPVGAVFAAAAAGTSLMALGAHGLAKAAGADVGWGSIALDGIGALPFVGGVAGRGAKVATSAERALHASRQNVLDYAASRAEEIGGEVAKKSTEGAKRAFAVIKADGVAGRFHTGVEAAYQNVREGEAIGTKGLNWTIDKLGGTGGIDPLSVGGRALDASIKGGKLVAAEVHRHLAGSDGPPPSASTTFCSRVAARGAA
jgi:type VII secretion system ESX-1 substrate